MTGRRSSETNPIVRPEQLVQLLTGWQPHRIVVAGDFMLDRYVYGNADRLSPDASVPVLAAQDSEHHPGGAAGLCLDLSALGCRVACVGVIGRDAAGNDVRNALADVGCDVKGLIAVADRRTTVKHNFVGLAQHRHPQKMFRLDEESTEPLASKTFEAMMTRCRQLVGRAAVLCLEDYGKGVVTGPFCRKLIALARRAKVPVLVDPAPLDDYGKYRGATCITPNRTEAALATGTPFPLTKQRSRLVRMAERLREDLRLSAIVLTLDRQGLLLAEKGWKPTIAPTQARSVYDVSGAGDMVLAMLAAARANGAPWPAAVELANIAAGLEVERFGAVPVELDEVLLALLEEQRASVGKIRNLKQLVIELNAHRGRGRRVALTNGCFDILHAGHVSFLRAARSQGDLLVVAVNGDTSIRRLKGPDRPVNQIEDRLMILSELESVDYLIVFEESTPMTLLRGIRPDILVKGAPYKRSEVVGGDFVESYGGTVHVAAHVKGRSTTNIIRKIESRSTGSQRK